MAHKAPNKTAVKILKALLPPLFWVGVWQGLYLLVGRDILLPSPRSVAETLWRLCGEGEFYLTVCMSLVRILLGFVAGYAAGALLGYLCARSWSADALLKPLLSIARATPIASFIILALVWMDKNTIPVFIAALIVLPVTWANVYEAVRSTSPDLLEMGRVFEFGAYKRFRHIYLPHMLPYLSSGAASGLGMAWKAGVAAEVLCSPANSIGSKLYNAKVYLESAELFAWTLSVILISVAVEKALMYVLRRAKKKLAEEAPV